MGTTVEERCHAEECEESEENLGGGDLKRQRWMESLRC
jgi:hypothetical protein